MKFDMSETSRIIPNLVGPRSALPGDVKTFKVTHPHSNAVPHLVQASTAADLRTAVETCQRAQRGWANTPLTQRIAVIVRAADLLEDEASGWATRFAEANEAETDVGAWWAHEQPKLVPGMMRSWCGVVEEALREEVVEEASSA